MNPQRSTRPSIVVQTVLSDSAVPWFDRWLDGVVNALVGAHTAHVLGSWRIAVGTISTAGLDAGSVTRYERLVRAAGGDFSNSALGTDIGYRGGHDRLVAEGDDDLVFVLDSSAVILTSTIVRMVRALPLIGSSLEARQVPLDGAEGRLSTRVGRSETGDYCLLLARSSIQQSIDHGRAMPSIWSVERPAVRCAEAVVFCDAGSAPRSEFATPPIVEKGQVSGSLLEEALHSVGLRDASDSVARALTVTGPPLLSVVMRTQVHRPEAMRDALLCLAGQSDSRFEVLLVVHNGDQEQARRILEDQPNWLRSRTQILTAVGGTRSRPLNVGIAAARGSLVAFLDDDDLVFGHWVETFLAAAVRHPRRLLRVAAGVQRVRTTVWPGGIEGYTSESLVSTPYPAVFDMADHLRVNMTPFMAFAFPRGFFAIGEGANESLEVCEDWDLVLRAARVLGVSDIAALTAIYRRWSSGRDSYSLHDSAIWDRDMARVQHMQNAGPVILPTGAARELAQLSDLRTLPAELAAVYASSSWRVTAPLRATVQRLKKAWCCVVAVVRRPAS
jgi:hypothetical protein